MIRTTTQIQRQIDKINLTLVWCIQRDHLDYSSVFSPVVVHGGRVNNKVKSEAVDQSALVKDGKGAVQGEIDVIKLRKKALAKTTK